jgi:hypothetical protein
MSDTPCKPVFAQPLRDTTMTEGQKLKLHAAVNAHPEPEVFYCLFDREKKNRFFENFPIGHLVSQWYIVAKFAGCYHYIRWSIVYTNERSLSRARR